MHNQNKNAEIFYFLKAQHSQETDAALSIFIGFYIQLTLVELCLNFKD